MLQPFCLISLFEQQFMEWKISHIFPIDKIISHVGLWCHAPWWNWTRPTSFFCGARTQLTNIIDGPRCCNPFVWSLCLSNNLLNERYHIFFRLTKLFPMWDSDVTHHDGIGNGQPLYSAGLAPSWLTLLIDPVAATILSDLLVWATIYGKISHMFQIDKIISHVGLWCNATRWN